MGKSTTRKYKGQTTARRCRYGGFGECGGKLVHGEFQQGLTVHSASLAKNRTGRQIPRYNEPVWIGK